ncbi:uncharacterized protein ARMOST_22689 [Armillaria ostoyae]|uniref:Uncharacterized protein n=1 Tax=Armillaria ostoyae TaxID=47428 RepID=A0A284S2R8_ARMOS|nr:uncharacterized protein ARMOST_04258 [Armillaria ostoyae]SJL15308.1 uncharacterized protein ARMOST_18801 [Armillaria ostoyae]SJL19081.1 uncharacterized protein ARMOST_22689 [Armillaria ostoyae]
MIPTFIVVKAVVMSLCKDPATTANDHLDQFQEYTSHLEHYKVELAKDKDLKESVFRARTAVEKEFHTNASKQPIHKVLKTITGWVQSERSQVNDGGASVPAIPTGPRRDSRSTGATTRSKGKGRSTRRSRATIESESDDDYDDPDKVAANSDSEAESIKMVIDDETAKVSKPLKFTKIKGNDAAVGEKRKEPSKEEPSGCTHCGVNSHPFADCPEKAHPTSNRSLGKDGARASKRAKQSFPLPSAREYFHRGAKGVGERRATSALGLTSTYAGEGGALPSVDSFRESHKGSTVGTLTVERPEHLAKLESALMGDVIVLQHTLYAAEKQREFLLDELERVQSALRSAVTESANARDTTPVEAEAPPAPSTSSSLEPPSA